MTPTQLDVRPWALGTAALTYAWYAMPDLVRCRFARGVLKTGLLVGATAAAIPLLKDHPATPGQDEWDALIAEPGKTAALIGGGLVASTAFPVWAEKKSNARGERRRARGKRWAHAGPAVLWAALAAAGVAADVAFRQSGADSAAA